MWLLFTLKNYSDNYQLHQICFPYNLSKNSGLLSMQTSQSARRTRGKQHSIEQWLSCWNRKQHKTPPNTMQILLTLYLCFYFLLQQHLFHILHLKLINQRKPSMIMSNNLTYWFKDALLVFVLLAYNERASSEISDIKFCYKLLNIHNYCRSIYHF